MSKYPFLQVDAFTDTPLGGNPCAVVFDTDGMSDATMLAIAKEMNLSETAFVRNSAIADFGVRYFTPAEEIPLAGHPTIATSFALVDLGRLVGARQAAPARWGSGDGQDHHWNIDRGKDHDRWSLARWQRS